MKRRFIKKKTNSPTLGNELKLSIEKLLICNVVEEFEKVILTYLKSQY